MSSGRGWGNVVSSDIILKGSVLDDTATSLYVDIWRYGPSGGETLCFTIISFPLARLVEGLSLSVP